MLCQGAARLLPLLPPYLWLPEMFTGRLSEPERWLIHGVTYGFPFQMNEKLAEEMGAATL